MISTIIEKACKHRELSVRDVEGKRSKAQRFICHVFHSCRERKRRGHFVKPPVNDSEEKKKNWRYKQRGTAESRRQSSVTLCAAIGTNHRSWRFFCSFLPCYTATFSEVAKQGLIVEQSSKGSRLRGRQG